VFLASASSVIAYGLLQTLRSTGGAQRPVARHKVQFGSIHRRMNDFHIALLWLHSLEALVGQTSMLLLSEVELDDLFVRYRSPYKA
jgi:hypothetical protein